MSPRKTMAHVSNWRAIATAAHPYIAHAWLDDRLMGADEHRTARTWRASREMTQRRRAKLLK